MFLFVAILAAALAYAWKEGVFDWPSTSSAEGSGDRTCVF